ncbi:MAG: lysophospholipid acyltransferase family protein [Chloroflexota bacterium]
MARALVAHALDLHVVGLEHVPARGACVLVARHYHHLYDAAAILATIQRDVHILVALDWLGGGMRLRLMRWLIVAARWPAVWRSRHGSGINRDGYRLSLSLLREGRLLLVFPEGYPTIDPQGSRKRDRNAWLPFDPGFLTLAERAGVPVCIVPVGMSYAERPGGGWTVWLRIGGAVHLGARAPGERRVRLESIEARVRQLSLPTTTMCDSRAAITEPPR